MKSLHLAATILAWVGSIDAFRIKLLFVEVGSNGVKVKPQLELGYEDANFQASAGIPDVRNGLGIHITGKMMQTFETEGRSLDEVIRNLEMDTSEAGRVGDYLVLARGGAASQRQRYEAHQRAEARKRMKAAISRALEKFANKKGFRNVRFGEKVRLKVTAQKGVGANAKVYLPWPNEEGFHMTGGEVGGAVGLEVTGGFAVGFKMRKGVVTALLVLMKAPHCVVEIRFGKAA